MGRTLLRRVLGLLAVISVAAVPLAAGPAPAAAAASTGTLFGMGLSTIYKIDTSTGALSPFTTLPPIPPTQMNQSFNGLASDPIGHRLFTVRSSVSSDFSTQFYDLVTVDTQTGAATVSPDMAQGAPELAFDTSSGALFGVTNFCCPFRLVRIDPVTGAQTHIADLPGVQESNIAIAPSKHAIYMLSESQDPITFQLVVNVITVDESGSTITESPVLTMGAFQVAYDTSTGTLFGKSFCCPGNLLKIDPATGAETTVETADLGFGSGFAMDPASHNIYMTQDVFNVFGFFQVLQSVNDQTGAVSVSTTQFPTGIFLQYLTFEGVAITPDSIKADVRSAFASGAITNAGVETSLLAELSAASDARSRGQCSVAAADYQAFIDELNAQSGKTVSSSTASQLISEAQFLIANCP
jgi:FIMAH domain-containing protein